MTKGVSNIVAALALTAIAIILTAMAAPTIITTIKGQEVESISISYSKIKLLGITETAILRIEAGIKLASKKTENILICLAGYSRTSQSIKEIYCTVDQVEPGYNIKSYIANIDYIAFIDIHPSTYLVMVKGKQWDISRPIDITLT